MMSWQYLIGGVIDQVVRLFNTVWTEKDKDLFIGGWKANIDTMKICTVTNPKFEHILSTWPRARKDNRNNNKRCTKVSVLELIFRNLS